MYRILPPFEYIEPQTVSEALETLRTFGEKAKLLAGGVDLVPRMRLREINAEYIVSIQKIPDLDYLKGNGVKGLRVGALVNIRALELSRIVQRDYLPLYEAAHGIASTQVKTMGTVVGNLCVGTPASDLVSALVSLAAKLRIEGLDGERIIPLEDLFVGVNQTLLQPSEMVSEVLLPYPHPGTGGAFLKLTRTADDVAKINVSVMLTLVGNKCDRVKIAIGSVAPTVLRIKKAEEVLIENVLNKHTINKVSEIVMEELKPISDIRSTAQYRTQMAGVLVGKAIEKAQDRAKSSNTAG